MGSCVSSAAASVIRSVVISVTGYVVIDVPSDIHANAIYANSEPIPDPAGGGYLTYGVST